jgi:hypothetical protein
VEPLGFISQSTENIFKFFFINGLIMIGVGMLYPLQMSNDIDLKIVDYNKKVHLLNNEISVLADDIDNLDTIVNKRINLSNNLVKKREKSLSPTEKIEITKKISDMKLETNKSFQQIKKNEADQNKNAILVKGDLEMISHLEAQQKNYDRFCSSFLIAGIIMGALGFSGWMITSYYAVDKDYHDYKERKRNRQNSVLPTDVNTPLPSSVLDATNPSSSNTNETP